MQRIVQEREGLIRKLTDENIKLRQLLSRLPKYLDTYLKDMTEKLVSQTPTANIESGLKDSGSEPESRSRLDLDSDSDSDSDTTGRGGSRRRKTSKNQKTSKKRKTAKKRR